MTRALKAPFCLPGTTRAQSPEDFFAMPLSPFFGLFLLVCSCSASHEQPYNVEDNAPAIWPPPPPSAVTAAADLHNGHGGELQLFGLDTNTDTNTDTDTDTELEGRFTLGSYQARLRVSRLTEELVDIELELNGMLLVASLDLPLQVAEVDGFSIDDGADTHMTFPDRALLLALTRQVEAAPGAYSHRQTLLRTLRLWSQTPDTAPLQRGIVSSSSSSPESLCEALGQYEYSSHDDPIFCPQGQQSGPQCGSWVQLGTRFARTHYYVNEAWTTQQPDHQPRLFETGECFGNCGPGCPTGPQTLTRDCLDHDHCVRNGHSLLSPYCLDEFMAASDDEFFGPDCPGT